MFKLKKKLILAALFLGFAIIFTALPGAQALAEDYDDYTAVFDIEDLSEVEADTADTPRWEVTGTSPSQTLTIKGNGNYLINGDKNETKNLIKVSGSDAVGITLNNVSMKPSSGSGVIDITN